MKLNENTFFIKVYFYMFSFSKHLYNMKIHKSKNAVS